MIDSLSIAVRAFVRACVYVCVCVCVCLYQGHSIKKVNIAEEVGNWKHFLQQHLFNKINRN